jgi:hypothetical protein
MISTSPIIKKKNKKIKFVQILINISDKLSHLKHQIIKYFLVYIDVVPFKTCGCLQIIHYMLCRIRLITMITNQKIISSSKSHALTIPNVVNVKENHWF